jgi:SulP family sulfate permease
LLQQDGSTSKADVRIFYDKKRESAADPGASKARSVETDGPGMYDI